MDLVNLGDQSQLKIALNRGVASLFSATQDCLRPHLCLNGKTGFSIMERIRVNPDRVNTSFFLSSDRAIVVCRSDIWLNLSLGFFIDELSSNTLSFLSPRQTGYIISNLDKTEKDEVLEKVKAWYKETFLRNMTKGLEKITEQIENGNLLIANDQENKVFDIHGGRHMDVCYTEPLIVGEVLWLELLLEAIFQPDGKWNLSPIDRQLYAGQRAR